MIRYGQPHFAVKNENVQGRGWCYFRIRLVVMEAKVRSDDHGVKAETDGV